MCPSNTTNTTPLTRQDPAPAPQLNTSYACNFHVFKGEFIPGSNTLSLAGLDKSAQKIMVGEGVSKDDPGIANHDWSSLTNFENNSFAKHLGTSNYLFADGHAKSLRPTATMTGMNMWGTFDDNGSCAAQDINCDDISSGALSHLAILDKNSQ